MKLVVLMEVVVRVVVLAGLVLNALLHLATVWIKSLALIVMTEARLAFLGIIDIG